MFSIKEFPTIQRDNTTNRQQRQRDNKKFEYNGIQTFYFRLLLNSETKFK